MIAVAAFILGVIYAGSIAGLALGTCLTLARSDREVRRRLRACPVRAAGEFREIR